LSLTPNEKKNRRQVVGLVYRARCQRVFFDVFVRFFDAGGFLEDFLELDLAALGLATVVFFFDFGALAKI
jgi:hypothetical protein